MEILVKALVPLGNIFFIWVLLRGVKPVADRDPFNAALLIALVPVPAALLTRAGSYYFGMESVVDEVFEITFLGVTFLLFWQGARVSLLVSLVCVAFLAIFQLGIGYLLGLVVPEGSIVL